MKVENIIWDFHFNKIKRHRNGFGLRTTDLTTCILFPRLEYVFTPVLTILWFLNTRDYMWTLAFSKDPIIMPKNMYKVKIMDRYDCPFTTDIVNSL